MLMVFNPRLCSRTLTSSWCQFPFLTQLIAFCCHCCHLLGSILVLTSLASNILSLIIWAIIPIYLVLIIIVEIFIRPLLLLFSQFCLQSVCYYRWVLCSLMEKSVDFLLLCSLLPSLQLFLPTSLRQLNLLSSLLIYILGIVPFLPYFIVFMRYYSALIFLLLPLIACCCLSPLINYPITWVSATFTPKIFSYCPLYYLL